jgi:hypothetical protein
MTSGINAQYLEQRNGVNDESSISFDLETKANELGISTNQLQKILNSASNNGGGDPLPDAMQERFFTGQTAGDNFGYSVASAGDINGDGYDDIIVGAPYNSASQGKAYLYFGGSVMNSIPDAVFSGSSIGAQFGYSVSSAGDVNGDGYDDIIIGSPNEDLNSGKATLIFGNSSMTIYSILLIDNPTAWYDDYFGLSVAGGGDVNSDGFADVVIGAPFDDLYGVDLGVAYVFYGGSTMNAIPDVTLAPALNISSGEYGQLVASAGDVNGDGFADVLVSAPGDGSIFLYLGGTNMNNAYDLIYSGAYADGAGDVNGDGYSDIVFGGNGEAYICFGGAAPDNNPDIIFTGETSFDAFGNSVAGAGDINGDGYDDVIIGAFVNDAGGTDAGRAYVYLGSDQMDNIKDAILTGAAPGDWFGLSLAAAGDVNGDGYADLIVGAPRNDTNGSNAGRSYLYTNSLTGTDIPDEFFTGNSNDQLGLSVSNVGDVNGDGYDDFIIGASYNDAGGTNAGAAYIYFGGTIVNNVADVTLLGANTEDSFGYSVSAAGDVNGDGYDDVIVGAPFFDFLTLTTVGRAYIFYGGSSMDNTADVILTGVGDGDHFGYSVSRAGDVNGDGYGDIIVGSPFSDNGGTNAGRAYIYFGGLSMNNIADVIRNGESAEDRFGNSVSAAGDVNGDGFDDVIIGAWLNDAGGTTAGRAYIYFGGLSMNNIANVILTGEAAGDYFGSSVSTAGDVNGDGFADIIVGSDNGGGTNAGRAYIYFGGLSMNNIADVILTGEAAGDYFGSSVSTAGDVNGDGFDDIIVGAYYNDAGGSNSGRTYIYFGGVVLNNVVDIVLTGTGDSNNFGWSVSSAGDINSDGISDVIVGAPGNSSAGFQSGRAYLYLSSPPPVKPNVISVKDIPNDQGGSVRVRWNRSAYDMPGQNRLSEYILQRSDPPGTSGFVWDYVASIPAMREQQYSYVAPTPADSFSNTNGTFYFRVIARGVNPDERWYSNIIYGHSVDNLAPVAPNNFYANLNSSNVKLGWKANTEPDFRNYNIYRSDTPGLEDIVLIATTNDTTFIDNSPLAGNAYYYIQAFDIHDNGSPLSADSIETILSANIRIFLEGAYVGGQMSTFLNSTTLIPLSQPYNTSPWNYAGTESVTSIPQNVVDWVLVELRSSEITVAEIRAAFLKNDGALVDLDGSSNIKFPSTPEGEYYVVIRHRNHLPIMTANKVGINFSPELYDMRTDLSKAYGTNALKNLGGGFFGIFTADTDGSGTVNASDRSNTWNQRNLSGYYGTDVDLSGTINAADRSSVWNNRNITTQVPAATDQLSTSKISGVNENE